MVTISVHGSRTYIIFMVIEVALRAGVDMVTLSSHRCNVIQFFLDIFIFNVFKAVLRKAWRE